MLQSKLFLFLCLVFVATVSVKAEEYKSMIRYDRVWEHTSVNYNSKTVYYNKFDGPEEINGKTYHRLVSFRKARYDYDAEGKIYLFDVDENYLWHEGYMREEDGKVYTLVTDIVHDDYGEYGKLYIPTDSDAHPSDLQEKLLYDFTCKEGESYHGLQGNLSYVEEMIYKVKSIESIEIDGEQHRRLLVSPEGYDDIELKMVEGVGVDSEYGCLTSIHFLNLLACPCRDHMFSRVLDMDGKEVYMRGEDPSRIPIDFLGVGSMAEQAEETAPIYDLYGRRISNPAPGQLYIQGGKKFIAR
ncbi:MAG: hypothetical protein K2L45_11495 [Muribaculaceae bacterium]|nr:hypothetical protein [Muribaculaceae bacterium]MDE6632538.1 hypothetical protein [Muribaculaceae bacterium]